MTSILICTYLKKKTLKKIHENRSHNSFYKIIIQTLFEHGNLLSL